MGLRGVREGIIGGRKGCGLGECGACTVLIDGVAARSCVIPVKAAQGREVTTLEGLGSRERPGPTQRAFIECQAAQCGYCLNGMIMTVEALLRRDPAPSEQALRSELHQHQSRRGPHRGDARVYPTSRRPPDQQCHVERGAGRDTQTRP
ncbi:hypothetical protein HGQ98_33320, partial [Achromobacter ruhlandii]|nr:hypothetical protein [Achromobacter ruhlandii]